MSGAAPGTGITYTVVMPVFNKVALLRPTLDGLMRAVAHRPDVEVIVVDNHSTDGAYEVAQGYAPRVAVHRRTGGISALRNWGARQGTGPRLSFVDSDVLVPPDYFERLDVVFAEGRAEAVGCEYHLPVDPVWSERVWHELTVREDDGYRHYLNAGNFAVARPVFERVGGFPEDFETAEDTELCRRLVLMGERIWQDQRVAAQHLGNPKTLAGFYRRLRWHGMGVWDGRRLVLRHKSTLMMLANVASLVAAAALLTPLGRALPWGVRWAAVAALALWVPVLTYAERLTRVRRLVNPPAALLLIDVMYAARAAALVRVVRRELASGALLGRGRAAGGAPTRNSPGPA